MEDVIVCRCEGVYYSEIKKSIDDGASEMTGIKLRTRAGMGPCQGRVCQNSIKKMLQDTTGGEKDIAQRVRFPLRPVMLENLIISDRQERKHYINKSK